ncbi:MULTISPECIES: hypothetical protein [Paenibacillus]|uniref:hypothetical protein n=1 Tax=Paenibacillus TaxID=44249 RepID=UPI000D70CE73|nr:MULTISPECIES: hypothetical protein [Paenibacillus]
MDKGIEITFTLKITKKIISLHVNNIAYFIEDLSDRISGAELNDSDREVLAPDMEDIVDPAAYDIQILEEEQWG